MNSADVKCVPATYVSAAAAAAAAAFNRRKSPMASPFKSSIGSLSSKGTSSWPGRSLSGSDTTANGFNQRLWGYLFRNVNR